MKNKKVRQFAITIILLLSFILLINKVTAAPSGPFGSMTVGRPSGPIQIGGKTGLGLSALGANSLGGTKIPFGTGVGAGAEGGYSAEEIQLLNALSKWETALKSGDPNDPILKELREYFSTSPVVKELASKNPEFEQTVKALTGEVSTNADGTAKGDGTAVAGDGAAANGDGSTVEGDGATGLETGKTNGDGAALADAGATKTAPTVAELLANIQKATGIIQKTAAERQVATSAAQTEVRVDGENAGTVAVGDPTVDDVVVADADKSKNDLSNSDNSQKTLRTGNADNSKASIVGANSKTQTQNQAVTTSGSQKREVINLSGVTFESILPSNQAEIFASQNDSGASLTLKTSQSVSPLFYARSSLSEEPLYLGRGISSVSTNQQYSYQLPVQALPQGDYSVYAQVSKKEDTVYKSQEVSISVNSAASQSDPVKTKEIEKAVETSGLAIIDNINTIDEKTQEASEKIAVKVSEKQTVKDAVKENVNQASGLIQTIEQLNHLLLSKIDERANIDKKISDLNIQIASLPDDTLQSTKDEKAAILADYQNQANNLDQEVLVVRKAIDQKKSEKETIINNVFTSVDEKSKSEVVKTMTDLEATVSQQERDTLERQAILRQDSDNDGLNDWQEANVYHTDLLNPDSDNDGMLDGDEVEHGFDPLKADRPSNIKSEDPRLSVPKKIDIYKVEKINLIKVNNKTVGIQLEGRGLPKAFVMIYIYSSPIVVAVRTDEFGRWNYTVDAVIDDGKHTVYAAQIDSQGEINGRSEEFVFVKSGDFVAKAATNQDVTVATSIKESKSNFGIFTFVVIILALMAALAVLGLAMRNVRHEIDNPESF